MILLFISTKKFKVSNSGVSITFRLKVFLFNPFKLIFSKTFLTFSGANVEEVVGGKGGGLGLYNKREEG